MSRATPPWGRAPGTTTRWLRRLGLALLALALAYGAGRFRDFLPTEPGPGPGRGTPAEVGRDAGAIAEAFRAHRSGVMVEADGVVERLLPDDRRGSRHQRVIVRLANGHTVLLTHNIDLAPRVPLDPGDALRFRGQYEWNDRGGVVHWTHHDPENRRPGGWIHHEGALYR